jgi:hypothetical protein
MPPPRIISLHILYTILGILYKRFILNLRGLEHLPQFTLEGEKCHLDEALDWIKDPRMEGGFSGGLGSGSRGFESGESEFGSRDGGFASGGGGLVPKAAPLVPLVTNRRYLQR